MTPMHGVCDYNTKTCTEMINSADGRFDGHATDGAKILPVPASDRHRILIMAFLASHREQPVDRIADGVGLSHDIVQGLLQDLVDDDSIVVHADKSTPCFSIHPDSQMSTNIFNHTMIQRNRAMYGG